MSSVGVYAPGPNFVSNPCHPEAFHRYDPEKALNSLNAVHPHSPLDGLPDHLLANLLRGPHYGILHGTSGSSPIDVPFSVSQIYGPAFGIEVRDFSTVDPTTGDITHYHTNPDGSFTITVEPNVGDQGQTPQAEASNSANSSQAKKPWEWLEVLKILRTVDNSVYYYWAKKGHILDYGDVFVSKPYYIPYWGEDWFQCVDIRFPREMTSFEVAKILLDNTNLSLAHKLAVATKPSEFDTIDKLQGRLQELQETCNEIAANLQTGVEVGVSLIPGGALVVSIYQATEKRYTEATVGVVLVPLNKIPWSKLLKFIGLGGVSCKIGGKAITVSREVAEYLAKLTPGELQQLEKNLAEKTIPKIKELLTKAARNSKAALKEAAEELARGAKARKILAANLGAHSYPVEAQAHHIFGVAQFDTPLGQKLQKWGINLNGAENGVWLPVKDYAGRMASLHSGRPVEAYTNKVIEQLNRATSKESALKILRKLRDDLLHGRLPINGVQ
ncbi:MAG: AHH domain-containing protein [Pirellulales bacterium]|nr:AHH domain-containing protein [Pirellulales bacterium]